MIKQNIKKNLNRKNITNNNNNKKTYIIIKYTLIILNDKKNSKKRILVIKANKQKLSKKIQLNRNPTKTKSNKI